MIGKKEEQYKSKNNCRICEKELLSDWVRDVT